MCPSRLSRNAQAESDSTAALFEAVKLENMLFSCCLFSFSISCLRRVCSFYLMQSGA